MLQSVLILILLAHLHYAQDGMGLIGDAYEAFAPCDEYVVSMSRIIGGPPQLENYWVGTFYLKKWPSLSEVRIGLTVDNPAKIELDKNLGRVLVSGRTFHISTYDKPPKIDEVKFTIRGAANGAFPNVEKITLNSLDVCKNPKQWRPTILGYGGNVGETEEGSDSNKNTCGRRLVHHEGLITHGFESNEGDWPWHAAIFHIENQKIAYRCGGTILNSNTILTAAHCVYENNRLIISDRLLVELGKHNLKVSGTHTQEFQVYKIVAHPNFSTSDLQNDIAIIRLSTEANLNNYIQPICLWDLNKVAISDVTNKNGIVIGWGVTETDDLSLTLRQAVMPIVPLTTCLNSNRDFFGTFLSEKNFCAGFRNGTSVCNGDSGGSMTFEENGTYHIRGIVSLSVARPDKHYCNSKEYVIFTDVAQYLTWIEETIAQTSRAPFKPDISTERPQMRTASFGNYSRANNPSWAYLYQKFAAYTKKGVKKKN